MTSFSVHIVLSDRGWILETLAKKLKSALPYVKYDEDADPSADIQYYMTYGTWKPGVSPLDVAYFAHLEKDSETAKHFFNVARKVDYCVCHSSPYEAILRDCGITHVRTISPGVDLDKFVAKVKIGVVGRTYHTGRKGEALVAQVMDIPGIEWYFTGAGWPGPAMNLHDNQMPAFYNSLDYVLVPSFYEGGPMSVVEALACGCEVIAPPVGWVPQFPHIEYKTGDVDDLRRVLLEVVAKKQKLRQAVMDRSWGNWVSGHDDIFSSLATRLEHNKTVRGAAPISQPRVKRPALVLHGSERGKDKGGPSVRAPKTALRLSRLGYDAIVRDNFMFDQREHDLYHVYNIWETATCRQALEHARISGAPIVLSPIYLDLSLSQLFDYEVQKIFTRSFNRSMINDEYRMLREFNIGHPSVNDAVRPEPYKGFRDDVLDLVDRVDHLIFLSEYEREALRAIGADVSSGTIIPNPVEAKLFAQATPDLFRNTYGVSDYVLCVGRIEPRKNQITLLHALRDSGLPIVLIGHATDPSYEQLLRSVGGANVKFIGRVAPNSAMLASAYAGARVFCLPSWSEGAPLVALEAAAAGCNLVLSSQSSEREYFGSRARYVHPADPEQILNTIQETYDTPISSHQRDELKVWVAENYTWERHIDATARVYEQVADSAGSQWPKRQSSPRMYVDLTSSAHRVGPPSGIARVEARYAQELYKLMPGRVHFVLWNSHYRQFVEVTYEQIIRNMHKLLPNAAAPSDLFYEQRILPSGKVKFEAGSRLLVLGSAWIRNPNYIASLYGVTKANKLILSSFIHDVIQAKFGHWFPDKVGEEFASNCRRVIEISDHLIVNSKCTLDDVREFCRENRLAAPLIDTVRFGDEIEQDIGTQEEPQFEDLLPLLDGRPFILCVSAIDIRKNHVLLYNLWERMIAQYGDETPSLIAVGCKGWNIDHFLSTLEKNERLKKRFHILTHINDASLDWLYRNCLFTVYPSHYEGWGLPVAESLNYGKVCVAGKAGSVPEIAPEYTDLLDPLDFPGWFSTVTGYAFTPHLLEARQKVISQYKPVSWRESAKALSEIIEDAAIQRRPPPGLNIGQTLQFSVESQMTTQPYAIGGWYAPEKAGTWTAGRVALLNFKLGGKTGSPLLLELSGCGFPRELGWKQTIEVWCEGSILGALAWPSSKKRDVIVIPADMASKMLDAPEVTLGFRIGEPTTPASRGKSADQRLLGMRLESLQFRQVDAAPLNAWVDPSRSMPDAAPSYAPIRGDGPDGQPNLKIPLFVRPDDLDEASARRGTVWIALRLHVRCAEVKSAQPSQIEVRTPTLWLANIEAAHNEIQTHIIQLPVDDVVNGTTLNINVVSGAVSQLEILEYGVFSPEKVCAESYPGITSHTNARHDRVGIIPSRGKLRLNGRMRPGDAGVIEGAGEDKNYIVSVPGKEGFVVFGPYIGLPAGDYRAVFSIRADLDEQNPVCLGIEVVYGSVLLARRDFGKADLKDSRLEVPFSVSADAALLLSEGLFEFRLSWVGRGKVVLMETAVEHVTSVQEGSQSNVDWLPMMAVVAPCRKREDWAVSAEEGVAGHFIHGPYRAMLPGLYTLICECDASVSGAASNTLTIEVGGAVGPVLASRDFQLRNGTNRIETAFEIKSPQQGNLPEPIEFRISKEASFAVAVTRLATRISLSSEGEPNKQRTEISKQVSSKRLRTLRMIVPKRWEQNLPLKSYKS